MHTSYIKLLLKHLELQKLLQHVSVYINHHQGATACAALELHFWFQYTCRYRCFQCHDRMRP